MKEGSSNDFIHLVLIPFTGVGLYGGYRGDAWFQERIEIFKEYTLKSLAAQTEKNFVVWCTFRPQEETNPLIAQIADALEDAGLRHVFTHDGLPYWDDKFGGSWKNKLKNAGRVIRGAYRNNTWSDVPSGLGELLVDKNSTLVERVGRSVKRLEGLLGRHDTVLLTRIDSDDMFRKDAVSLLQKTWEEFGRFEAGAMTIDRGYITDGREVAEYNPSTNPPFHTLTFGGSTFFDGQRHVAAYRGYKSHEDLKLWSHPFEGLYFNERLFCVTTTNPSNHISTTFNHPFKGKTVDSAILKDFGL